MNTNIAAKSKKLKGLFFYLPCRW